MRGETCIGSPGWAAPDRRRLGAHGEPRPEVAEAAPREAAADRDDERALAPLRQADVREHVDLRDDAVAEAVLELGAQGGEVLREAPHKELARVLHHDHVGAQDACERSDPRDEGVACVVDDVVLRKHPREAGARRAGRQNDRVVGQREHVAHVLGRHRPEVDRERLDSDVPGERRVAPERPRAVARLADLGVGGPDDLERRVALEAAAHAARAGEQVHDCVVARPPRAVVAPGVDRGRGEGHARATVSRAPEGPAGRMRAERVLVARRSRVNLAPAAPGAAGAVRLGLQRRRPALGGVLVVPLAAHLRLDAPFGARGGALGAREHQLAQRANGRPVVRLHGPTLRPARAERNGRPVAR
jgi:hypothetical protein